jgi:Peptidase A4 family
MLRRWCIAFAGVSLVMGTVAMAGPAAAAAAPGTAHVTTGAHLIRPGVIRPGTHGTRPMVGHGFPRNQDESTNWSGYAASGATYTSVSANWVEPTGTCSSGDQYSSFWVGLDGFNSDTVEQTGSEVDCDGRTVEYYSWYEMYPAFPVNFTNTVRPGDHFHGSVTFNGGSSYTLVLQDTTRGWSHTVHASLSGAANSSAEVIAEAPCCTASGGILPLAHFSPITFSSATVDGSTIGSFSPDEIVMVDSSGLAKDAVSALSGGNSFTVTWLRSN